MQDSTIAAIATAPGAGGIAVVRLSGPESYAVAARVFRPANPDRTVAGAKGYTALFGTFLEGEDAFDEGVALFFRAPHSYTGEDVVELSCHGGSAVARRLVESCIEAGAAPAAPGEYTRRAFLNGKLSLTQAEAVMDLVSADGRQGAALANASLGGALARKIAAEKEALTSLQAHLAAWVDFPEEDVPELDETHLQAVLGSVKDELDVLIRNYDAGAVLREGVDCAIVGRPNAGKSTLLEAMMSKYEERDEEEPGMLYDGTEAYKIYANVLPEHIKLIETQKPEKHFFFRAESFFNHAAELDRQAQLELRKYSRIYAYKAYGGRSLLEQSHGESFLCAFLNYASRNTLFILDEPEAALSPQRQLALLVRIHELVNNGCQLIISTHSPILMAYPNADIYAIDDTGAHVTPYEDTEQMMKELLG